MPIDYGRFPMSNGMLPNRDPENGVRYGIVNLDSLSPWAIEAFEPEYACGCPECGHEMDGSEELPEVCPSCGYEPSDNSDWWGDDPICWYYDADGYQLVLDELNDVWIFKSPYTVEDWEHCSPCAPGAAYTNGPVECRARTSEEMIERGDSLAYCLDEEWFENEDNKED